MVDDPIIAVAVRITGRVQGVWFRGWMCGEAQRMSLTGSVRNQPDGSVGALVVGQGAAVAAMLALCHKGPPLARVDNVETKPVTPGPTYPDFRVVR
ncbi:MAG TPA: acylphosphatase [Thermohalobaculum sp.]|nr:acylphosphatase [Thermohalobaculum sp.]